MIGIDGRPDASRERRATAADHDRPRTRAWSGGKGCILIRPPSRAAQMTDATV
jgi:hypothetical protein